MLNHIGTLEKTVVRGGDKLRKLEYVRNLCWHAHSVYIDPSFVSSLHPIDLPLQETMLKIKQCIVEEKKDVRFGTWSAAEVKG